jgi:pSer/pThr/pTyr-binding forkhead associated (FHA) protein
VSAAGLVLLVTGGPLSGQRIDVDGDVVIGRMEGDVVLDDDQVSRRHAVLRNASGRLTIEDLGSTNGTRVNGRRIDAAVQLADGDTVEIGRTSLRVEAIRTADATVVAGREAAPRAAAEAMPTEPPRTPFAARPGRRRRGIATRDVRAEVLTFLALFGTAAALLAYFALR